MELVADVLPVGGAEGTEPVANVLPLALLAIAASLAILSSSTTRREGMTPTSIAMSAHGTPAPVNADLRNIPITVESSFG